MILKEYFTNIENYKYPSNLFYVIPLEELKIKYIQNCLTILPTVLESLNLQVNSDDFLNPKNIYETYRNNINSKNNETYIEFKTPINYKLGPLHIGIGLTKWDDLPPDIKNLISLPPDINEKIKDFFYNNNICPWDDIEHKIHGSKKWYGIKESLKTAMFLDIIYEVIAKSKDRFLFGKLKKRDLLLILRNDISDIPYFPSLYSKYFDSDCNEDDYTYLYKVNSIHPFEMDKIIITKPSKNLRSKTSKVLYYYYEVTEQYVNPKHELYEFYRNQCTYTKASKAKNKGQSEIPQEYALLYQQLPYLYMAKWLTEVKREGNKLPSFAKRAGCKKDTKANERNISCQLRTLTINDDIDKFINYPKIFKKCDKNLSANTKIIYNAYFLKYLSNCCYRFQACINKYYGYKTADKNISKDNVQEVIFEIFRFGHLLSHSTFFKALLTHLLSKASVKLPEQQEKISSLSKLKPSFFLITFLILLSKQHKSDISITRLDEEIKKYEEAVSKTVDAIVKEDNNTITAIFESSLEMIYGTYQHSTKCVTITAEYIKDFISPFINANKEDIQEEWEKLNKIMSSYTDKK